MYTKATALQDGAIHGAIENAMSDREFNFISTTFFQEALALKTLRGELLGCNFKHHINSDVCRKIAQRFWDHPELSARGDAVKAYQIGSFHYRKPLDAYFAEVEAQERCLMTFSVT